ncbi:MAG TPA: hypothetical protein VFX98_13845, partial [Longimicrobiaceae bacterium]|nr:hypothetical protein [Longimicrobiaceae bacterium]
MQKRALILLPLGLAACLDAPLAPAEPDAAVRAGDAPSASITSLDVARERDLAAAIMDARIRILPTVPTGSDALAAALERLDASLAARDAA